MYIPSEHWALIPSSPRMWQSVPHVLLWVVGTTQSPFTSLETLPCSPSHLNLRSLSRPSSRSRKISCRESADISNHPLPVPSCRQSLPASWQNFLPQWRVQLRPLSMQGMWYGLVVQQWCWQFLGELHHAEIVSLLYITILFLILSTFCPVWIPLQLAPYLVTHNHPYISSCCRS